MVRRLLVAGAALAVVATGGALAGPAAPARAATPAHVGIVVAGLGSYCVPYRSGMTGADVLNAHFDVVYGQAPPYVGFVFTIDGVGNTRPDNTHYWAYYHGGGGSWTYSGSGAATYRPRPGTVEGWAYDDGGSSAPQPPATTYAALCGSLDPQPAPVSTPRPAPQPATTSVAAPRPATAPASRPVTTSGRTGPLAPGTSPGSSTADSTERAPAPRGSGSARASSAGRGTTSSGVDAAAAGTTAPAPSTESRAAQVERNSAGSSAPASIAALVAVLGLGGGAFWRMRRQRAS